MKEKGMVLGLVVTAILALFAAALSQEGASRDFTHTVFGEFGSSTT